MKNVTPSGPPGPAKRALAALDIYQAGEMVDPRPVQAIPYD